MPSTRTNWHEAVTCAIQIDLMDYSHLLEYDTEHYLSKTSAIDRRDVTLTFPTFHYPRNLFKHLTKECKITIENPFPGVYYINKEMYATQVLVIKELSPEDSMYLHCLTKNLNNQNLINNLADDYALNKNNTLYTQYMNQFLGFHMKGEQLMVCENLFKLYGTSSEEIAEKTKAQYIPLIQKLTSENNTLTSQNDTLTSQNNLLTSELNKLKQLLAQNNIAY